MDQAVLNSMTAAEQPLVAETSLDAMAGLVEEELVALHSRVRRARSKYVSKYRRHASGAVMKRAVAGGSACDRDRLAEAGDVASAWCEESDRGLKRAESSRAAGARRQAKRDSR
jgi:hypothetical protein